MELGFVSVSPRGAHYRQSLCQQMRALFVLVRLSIGRGKLGQILRPANRCPRGLYRGEALPHLGDAFCVLALRGQRYAPGERPQSYVARQAMLSRQGQHGLGVRLDCVPLPAIALEESTPEQRINQAERVRQRVRHGQRLLTPLHGLVWIAQHPEDPGQLGAGAVAQPGVLCPTRGAARGGVPLGVEEGDPLLQVRTSGGEGTSLGQGLPQGVVGPQEQSEVGLTLGEAKELRRYGLRRLELRPYETERPQTEQHRAMLQGLLRLLTQR